MDSPRVEPNLFPYADASAPSAAPTARSNTSPYRSRTDSLSKHYGAPESSCNASQRRDSTVLIDYGEVVDPHPYHTLTQATTDLAPTMVPHEMYTVLCRRWGVVANTRLLEWLMKEVCLGPFMEADEAAAPSQGGEALSIHSVGNVCRPLIRGREGLTLDFSTNYLGPNGLRPVLSLIVHCPFITHLVLRNNMLQHSSITQLVAILDHSIAPWLHSIDLGDNPMLTGATGSGLLVFVSKNVQISSLKLDGTGISRGQMAAIDRVVARNAAMNMQDWHRSINLSRASINAIQKVCAPVRTESMDKQDIISRPSPTVSNLDGAPLQSHIPSGLAELFAAAGLSSSSTSPPLKILREAADSAAASTINLLRAANRSTPPPPIARSAYPALGLLCAALRGDKM